MSLTADLGLGKNVDLATLVSVPVNRRRSALDDALDASSTLLAALGDGVRRGRRHEPGASACVPNLLADSGRRAAETIREGAAG